MKRTLKKSSNSRSSNADRSESRSSALTSTTNTTTTPHASTLGSSQNTPVRGAATTHPSSSKNSKQKRTLGTSSSTKQTPRASSNNNNSEKQTPRTLPLSGSLSPPGAGGGRRGRPAKHASSPADASAASFRGAGGGGAGGKGGNTGPSAASFGSDPSMARYFRSGSPGATGDSDEFDDLENEDFEKLEKEEKERLKKLEAARQNRIQEKAKQRRARALKQPLPSWLVNNAGSVFEFLPHPADSAVLAQTNKKVREEFVAPNILRNFGSVAAASVLTSSEYYRQSGGAMATGLEERKKQLGQPLNIPKQRAADQGTPSDDDVEVEKLRKKYKVKKSNESSGDDHDDDGSSDDGGGDDQNASNKNNKKKTKKKREEPQGPFCEDPNAKPHSANIVFDLLSSVGVASSLVQKRKKQEGEEQDDGDDDEMLFRLASGALPDKKSSDVFLKQILLPLAEKGEIQHANLSSLPSSTSTTSKNIEEFYYNSRAEKDVGLVSDNAVALLAQRNHDLISLSVSGRHAVTGVGLSVVGSCCTLLRSLDVSYTNATDSSICLVASYCRHLESVSVEGCGLVTDRAVSSLSIWNRASLKELNVSFTAGNVTDRSLGEIVARCSKMERIVARHCGGKVTDELLLALCKAPFVANADSITDRELTPRSSPLRGTLRSTPEEVANSVPRARTPPRTSKLEQQQSSSASASASASAAAAGGGLASLLNQRTEVESLWSTLKEVDLRGSEQSVSWATGLLTLVEHTAKEHQKRHRRALRRRAKASATSAASSNEMGPQLVVVVDDDVFADVPQSPVIENIHQLLRFSRA